MIKWRLKVLMAERDMDNTQLMELTQLHRNTITKLKNNRPDRLTIDTLNRLCQALDCQPGDLMSYIPDTDRGVN
jgi:putative transcriptional regulator